MIPGNTEGSWGYKWMFRKLKEALDRHRRQTDAKRPGISETVGVCPVVVLPFLPYPFP